MQRKMKNIYITMKLVIVSLYSLHSGLKQVAEKLTMQSLCVGWTVVLITMSYRFDCCHQNRQVTEIVPHTRSTVDCD